MRGDIFIDTNLFIYAIDRSDRYKHEVSKNVIAEALRTNDYHISYQIVQEFINVSLKKLKNFSSADCTEFVELVMFPLVSIYPSKELYTSAIRIHDRWNLSFYDSLVIAAASSKGAKKIYTEDLQHNMEIDGLKVVNPFIE